MRPRTPSVRVSGPNDRNLTRARIASRIAPLEASVGRHTDEMARVDRQEAGEARAEKVAHIGRRQGRIRQEIPRLQAMNRAPDQARDGQISLTDPDARAMATSAKNSGGVGCNVQAVVDSETHLIVAHDVTNQGHDRGQLASMAFAAREALDRPDLHVLAGKGCFSGIQVPACHQKGIATTVPRPEASGNRVKGRYVTADFAHDARADVCVCPAGEQLSYRSTTEEDGLQLRRDRAGTCQDCPVGSHCTTGRERRIPRWEHEELVEAAEARLRPAGRPMTVRRSTVEHPFGTIRAWTGSTHFLMRGLRNVRTEMALNVLACTLRRMSAILGLPRLIAELRPAG